MFQCPELPRVGQAGLPAVSSLRQGGVDRESGLHAAAGALGMPAQAGGPPQLPHLVSTWHRN